MSNYNSYVGSLASSLESSNMQKHMGTMTDDISPRHREILQHFIDYDFSGFVTLIYRTTLGRKEEYWDGQRVKRFFVNHEEDFVPMLSKINEDCLNDPELSKAIVSGELYAKDLGNEVDYIHYYPPHHVGSVDDTAYMHLLYVPSASPEQPNRFRIDVKQVLREEKDEPYINFSVDFGDDGSIKYNQPVLIRQPNKDDDTSITITPCDMSLAHIQFNEEGVKNIQDTFMYIFEKTGIKDDTDIKRK